MNPFYIDLGDLTHYSPQDLPFIKGLFTHFLGQLPKLFLYSKFYFGITPLD